MPSLGPMEIILIILVIVVLFGWNKLPDAARSLGRSMRIFKSEVEEMKKDKPSASKDTVPGTTVPPAQPGQPPCQQPYQQPHDPSAYQPPQGGPPPYQQPQVGQPQYQAPYQPPQGGPPQYQQNPNGPADPSTPPRQ